MTRNSIWLRGLLVLTPFLLSLASARPVSAQPAAAPPPLVRENATVKLSDHVHVILDNNVPLVPNVGIVVGSRGTLVIDPGLGRRNGETVLREATKAGGNRDLFIASTHYHAEHTLGYLAFPPSAKYVNSTIQEAEFAEGGMQMARAFSGRSPLTAELLSDAAGRKADITFDRDYRLDLGGVHVRFLVVGPTHTKGDTVFFVEEDRVLFSGDVVMKDSFLAANAASSMKAWLAAFDRLDALGARLVVPSHGATGDATVIGANRTFMKEIDARVRELKASGRTADEAAATVQRELQAQHPQWPRANGVAAAARSAHAEAP